MKVKCPACGAVGTDRRSLAEELRGPSWRPTRAEEQYAFEVYGNLGGRPVRKCFNCGAGIRVTFLPPRFRRLSDEEWAEFKVRFETWRAEDRARTAAWRAEQDAQRRQQVEELTELVRTHLLDMEAQGPQVYPDWALRQFVKFTVIAEVAPHYVAAGVVTASEDDPSPERAGYEQQLDRVLRDEGLISLAEEIIAAVTISSDDWDQMTEEERRKMLERDADDVVP